MRDRLVVQETPLNAATPLAALAHDVTPVDLHYVRNHFAVPDIDPAQWTLDMGGTADAPRSWTLDELRALPQRTLTVTMECAGNGRTRMRPLPPGTPWNDGAVSTATWTGTPLKHVVEEAAPRRGAREVLFEGLDHGVEGDREMTYARSLPLAEALRGDVLLAHTMNGEPLQPFHGAPVRLVVPGWYGMASVKWLSRVLFLTEPYDGWFQRDRYVYAHDDASDAPPVTRMRVRSIIAAPTAEETLPAGERVEVTGRAWSGEGKVDGVDVSTDGGRTWHVAELTRTDDDHAWARFAWTWTDPQAGDHVLLSRAHDDGGNVQPLDPPSNTYGYGNNAVLPVAVRVV